MHSDSVRYRPEIAGLRAFAVLSVLIFHINSSWLPGGFVGVDVFFVISGYLISRIIFQNLKDQTFSISNFYARRVKRILPALILILLACWIYGYLFLFPYNFRNLGKFQNTASFFYLNFILIGDVNYFDVSAKAKPLLHLWSLSIEEQFYIVWPILVVLLSRLRRRVLPVLIFLALTSFIFAVYKTAATPSAAYYLPWTRSWELMLGGIVAWHEVKHREYHHNIPDTALLFLSITGLTLLVSSILIINQNHPFPGWRAIFPTLGAAMILFIPANRLVDFALGNRIAEAIGSISYPLYLWHWPVLAFSRLELGEELSPILIFALVLITFGLAWATMKLIELPIGRLFERNPKSTVAALLSGLVAVGVLGIVTHDLNGMTFRFSPEVSRILDFPNSVSAQSLNVGSTQVVGSENCSYDFSNVKADLAWHTKNIIKFYKGKSCLAIRDQNKPTIVLVGDSHGAHLSFGLRATLSDKFNIIELTTSYCAPLIQDVLSNQGRGGTERCKAYNNFVFEQLRHIKPDIVLAGIYYWNFIYKDDWFYPGYIDALNQNSADLITSGIGTIILAGQVPTWSPSLKEVVAREVHSGFTPQVFSLSGVNRIVFDIDRDLKAYPWADKVNYVSLIDTLCKPDGCRRLKGGNIPEDLMAIDYGHLSQGGSEFIFQEFLRKRIITILQNSHQIIKSKH